MSRLKIFSLGLLVIGVVICLVGLGRNYLHNDKTEPVIAMEEDTVAISVKDDDDAILAGVTATDDKDGDVTDRLVVSSLTPFTDEDSAERIAVIAAFDQANNISFAKRKVTYSDYTPMQFSLSAPLRFPVGDKASGSWTDEEGKYLLQVSDCIDGDISSQIQYLGMDSVDSKTEGTYTFTVRVTNSAGDTESFPLSVEYYDPRNTNDAPIAQLESYLITVNAGDEPNLENLVTSVRFRGVDLEPGDKTDIPAKTFYEDRIEIDDSDVNYDTPGVYEAIVYTTYAGDKDKEEVTGSVRLVIVVR